MSWHVAPGLITKIRRGQLTSPTAKLLDGHLGAIEALQVSDVRPARGSGL